MPSTKDLNTGRDQCQVIELRLLRSQRPLIFRTVTEGRHRDNIFIRFNHSHYNLFWTRSICGRKFTTTHRMRKKKWELIFHTNVHLNVQRYNSCSYSRYSYELSVWLRPWNGSRLHYLHEDWHLLLTLNHTFASGKSSLECEQEKRLCWSDHRGSIYRLSFPTAETRSRATQSISRVSAGISTTWALQRSWRATCVPQTVPLSYNGTTIRDYLFE